MTKEEIEQIAANLANPNVCKTTNWIEGYTQCQEDMADKKYTEEDIRNAIREGRNSDKTLVQDLFLRLHQNLQIEEDFINSLNKQD